MHSLAVKLMHITFHAGQRMNQRGITKELIDFVIKYGEIDNERRTVTRDAAVRLVAELRQQGQNREMRIAVKVLDKGGMTVIFAEDLVLDQVVISTYNSQPGKKGKKQKAKSGRFHARNCVEQAFGSQRRKYYAQ